MAMKDQKITSNTTQAEDEMLSLSDPFSPMYTQTPQEEMLLQRRRRTNEKGKTKKRRLSGEQVKLLELSFCSEHTLKSERRDRLASEVGLDPHVVAVWFQNRRARWKAKHLEEEYEKLKMVHQTLLIDKCHLEAEVLKLQVQVSEAKKEIKKLSGCFEGVWCGERSCSESSPLSVDAFQPFLEEVAAEEDENFLYFPEYCYNDDMKWVSLYSF